MLLLHIPGAKSFENLRTVDNIMCDTFKEAASQRGLLESDSEWENCLNEAATYQMARQMCETFAFICCFCSPNNPFILWNKFEQDLSLNFRRSQTNDAASNMALHEIEMTLKQHGS